MRAKEPRHKPCGAFRRLLMTTAAPHRSLQVIPLLSTSHVATKPTSSNGRTVGAHDLQFNNALVLAFTEAFGARMAQDTRGFASTNAKISRLKPSPVQRRIVLLYLDGVFTNRWTKSRVCNCSTYNDCFEWWFA